MRRGAALFSFVVFTTMLRAHPEIEQALTRINAQLAVAPQNAELYLERGELYARHAEWVSADANYLRAAELAANHPGLARARGALELATGRPAEARKFLDAAMAADPRDAEALVLRSRAHAALHQKTAAIADLDRAIVLMNAPSPELFLERAALLSPVDALRSLDAAIEQIGPVISLQLRAIALEESLGRIDAAVARIDGIAIQSERKETWLKRRGDLFARAGRDREARATYVSALAAIAALPAWLRESPDTARLAAELAQLTSSRS
jgi:tetratricopeptide (TPR) repeat protein